MKILYTLNSGTPGGMERHVRDLVAGMTSLGHEVYVWCNTGTVVDWYKEAGAKVFINKVHVTFGIDIDPLYIFKLVKFLKKYQIDVLHSHELRAVGNSLLAGFIAGTCAKISIIHTPFSEWPIPKWKKTLYTRCYSIAVTLFADYEIALTESRFTVKIKEGIPSGKLKVLPNGIDDNKFNVTQSQKEKYKNEILTKYNIPKDRYIFGNVSRLTEEKGHDILIKAFSHFLNSHPDLADRIHLLIAGGGVLESSLRSLVDHLKITNSVTFTSQFPEEEHVKMYNAMDAFIFPSLAEGFGLVLIEAMIAKLPIICSDLEVLREVGESCVYSYIKVLDYKLLTEKMYTLYLNKNTVDGLVNKAKQRVLDNYSLSVYAKNYENLYTGILEKRGCTK